MKIGLNMTLVIAARNHQVTRRPSMKMKEAILKELFPEADNKMDSEEEKDHVDYKTSILVDHRKKLENMDNFLPQVCALQYMPSTTQVTKGCPYGTVA
jgi:hypothetical protein